MLKRRDWKLLHRHDQEGSIDSSSSDDDDDNKAQASSNGGQPSDSDDDGQANPMQVPSSDSSASASHSDDEPASTPNNAAAIAARWLQPGNAEADTGYALRCRVCPGKVLLSAASLRSHAASAKHIKNLKHVLGQDDTDAAAFCLSDAEEDCETHEERLLRIAALAAKIERCSKEGVSAKLQQKTPAALRRERRERKKIEKKGRPGKRQRQAARGVVL